MNIISSNIKLSDYFDNQLNSRFSVRSILSKIKNEDVIIDFININFISRSAAHELLYSVDKFAEKGVKIIFKNLNTEVQQMLNKVDSCKNTNNKYATYVNKIFFDSEKKLDDFFLDWIKLENSIDEFADSAADKTDEKLASKTSSITRLTDDEILELFPEPSDVKKLFELMKIVKSGERKNDKINKITANSEKLPVLC